MNRHSPAFPEGELNRGLPTMRVGGEYSSLAHPDKMSFSRAEWQLEDACGTLAYM